MAVVEEEGSLHVWQAALDDQRWPSPDGLPAAERERAAKMRAGAAQNRWTAARWALRGVLANYLGQAPAAIELRAGERGKPHLADPDASLHFNLSHSGDLAVVAVSGELEVGIDVEQIKPRGDLMALAKRALPVEEVEWIGSLPADERLAAFHAAWTRREAVAKCLGLGLTAPLPPGPVKVSTIEAFPGFAMAVAVAAEQMPSRRLIPFAPALA